jgi:hypothetical protein
LPDIGLPPVCNFTLGKTYNTRRREATFELDRARWPTARVSDVPEYLREAGWRECAIGAATTQTGAHAGTGYATTNELELEGRWRNPVEG